MIYEVGKPFPTNFARGVEECRSSVNEAFFDVLYYIKNPTPVDTLTWRKDRIAYGVYEQDDIPFFIIDFTSGGWNFDLTLNIFKVQENEIENWLNADGNIIQLYLIDADTNILHGMRMISILTSVSEQIRDILERQLETYSSTEEVDAKTQNVMQGLTTSQMITKTKMYLL